MVGGKGKRIKEMSVQSMRATEKDFCLYFLQLLLENIDKSRHLIPVLHNPHLKGRPSPSEVALTMEYLVGAPSKVV